MAQTPAEKAKELVLKYYGQVSGMDAWYIHKHVPYPNSGDSHFETAKKCALIAVNFAIDAVKDCSVVAGYPLNEYQQVKEAISKL